MPATARSIVTNHQSKSSNALFCPPSIVGVIDKGSLTQLVVLTKKDFVSFAHFPFSLGLGQGKSLQDPIPNVGPLGNLSPTEQEVKELSSQVFLSQNIPPNSYALKDVP